MEGEGLTLRNSLLLSGFSVFSVYDMLWEVKFHLQIIFGGDCPLHYPTPVQIRPYSLNECGLKPT